jgi:hypothetical protein
MLMSMWTRLWLLCGLAATAWAQGTPASQTQTDDPKDLLLRVRNNLMATIQRLPRYTCTLTIDRAQYEPDALHRAPSCDDLIGQKIKGQYEPRLSESDRLRLDVAIAASNEIYSWVGEDRFDDRDLFDLVQQGAVQTGSFSTFLTSIFSGTSASFSYNGDTAMDGRPLVEFGFQVPREKSNYVFGNRREHVTTGYEGTFLADPKTGDLVRLMVRTSELPAGVGSCQATTTLDYKHVHLNDSNFLLPREALLDILNTDGVELRNRTVYSSCHEFLGESTLIFDEPAAEAAKAATKASAADPFKLPAGLPFKVAFTQPIDTAAAAAGDRIKAKLTSSIRDASSKVLVPEGAEIAARILKLQRFEGPPASVRIIVKLEALNAGGAPRPFHATMILTGQRFEKSTGLQRSVALGSFDTLADSGAAMFEFRDAKPNFVVKSGLESAWTTAGP